MLKTVAILLAAGNSSRMQGAVEDKMLFNLLGKPAFTYSIEAFLNSGITKDFILSYRDLAQKEKLESFLSPYQLDSIQWVKGGERRQDSVYNCLKLVPEDTQYVFIHDCSRPLIQGSSIQALLKAVIKNKAATAAHRSVDTIMEVDETGDCRTLNRSKLWSIETPQAFEFPLIKSAYEQAQSKGLELTDDTGAAIIAGHQVSPIETPYPNPKLTHPSDILVLETLLKQKTPTKHVTL